MIETNEEDIEDWYFNHSGENPLDFICDTRVLNGKDTGNAIPLLNSYD